MDVKLSPAATEYLLLFGQMFQARLEGKDDTEILDKMDVAWHKLTEAEIDAMNAVSQSLNPVMSES